MKRMLKGILVLAALTCFAADAATEYGKSYFNLRPFGKNMAREMSGAYDVEHRLDVEELYGNLDVTFGYSSTWKPENMGKFLSFNSSSNSFTVGQSPGATATAGTYDVAAINFLLGDTYNGTMKFEPKITNIFADFGAYVGLDEFLEGLYIKARFPIVRTKWDIGAKVSDETTTTTDFAIGEINHASTVVANPGKTLVEGMDGQFILGDVATNQEFGRLKVDGDTKTALADIALSIGYDFIKKERGTLGLYVHGVAPTGTRPEAKYIFEPIVGNGKHWELGGGLTGKVNLWEKDDEEQSFVLAVDARGTHMFKTTQKRSFDLTGHGKGSRYLLLKHFSTASTNAYDGTMVRGIDKTTLDAKVGIDFQGEGAAMFTYKYKGFTFDLGYNIWGRTAEKFKSLEEDIPAQYGCYEFEEASAGVLTTGAVNTKLSTDVTIAGYYTTANTDSLTPAAAYYIATTGLDTAEAMAPSALTHKAFAHMGYRWDNDWMPHVGVGGDVEFAQDNKAAHQWSVWGKLGFCF